MKNAFWGILILSLSSVTFAIDVNSTCSLGDTTEVVSEDFSSDGYDVSGDSESGIRDIQRDCVRAGYDRGEYMGSSYRNEDTGWGTKSFKKRTGHYRCFKDKKVPVSKCEGLIKCYLSHVNTPEGDAILTAMQTLKCNTN